MKIHTSVPSSIHLYLRRYISQLSDETEETTRRNTHLVRKEFFENSPEPEGASRIRCFIIQNISTEEKIYFHEMNKTGTGDKDVRKTLSRYSS